MQHTDQLIKMANQIAVFFDAMPDRVEALEGVAMHIKRSWAPSMRRALLAHVDSRGDAALHRLAAEAIARHRDTLG